MTAVRDRVTIGQRWRRRRDCRVFRIHMVWRADRELALKGDDPEAEIVVVDFTTLREKWVQL